MFEFAQLSWIPSLAEPCIRQCAFTAAPPMDASCGRKWMGASHLGCEQASWVGVPLRTYAM